MLKKTRSNLSIFGGRIEIPPLGVGLSESQNSGPQPLFFSITVKEK